MMWDQIKDEMSGRVTKKVGGRRSSPVTTTRMDPAVIREMYPIKEPDIVPSRGLEPLFEEEDISVKKEPVRKNRSGRAVTTIVSPEKARELVPFREENHPSFIGFTENKSTDVPGDIEMQKEMDKEYKSERKEMKKNPEGPKENRISEEDFEGEFE